MKKIVINAALILWLLAASLGSFILFLYGGNDDSPGAQLLALVIVIGAATLTVSALRRRRIPG